MVKVTADKMPDLKGLSTGDIIDMLGECRFEKSQKTRLEGYLKEALNSRMDIDDEGHGDAWFCVVTEESRTSLDTAKVKDEMGMDWYSARCQTSEFRKISTKLISSLK